MKHFLLYLFFCVSFITTKAQNCKTLYDTACQCRDSVPPAAYIRNGSFEDHSPVCFPGVPGITNQHSVNYWECGVDNGDDYYYLGCNVGYDYNEIPLPIPDGKAVLELFDLGSTNNRPHKGYISTCLGSPLLAGVTYRFEFYIGFSLALQDPSYSPHNFAIFGHPSCDSIPFGFGAGVGCPTNETAIGLGFVRHGWMQLGIVSVAGNNDTWVKAHIDFTPSENINGFTFGPDCTDLGRLQTSYFADNFSLTKLSQLRFKMITADSNCTNGVVLHAPANTRVKTYQWYKDSTAITGATGSIYTVSASRNATGNYNVRMVFPDRCIVSDPFYVDLSLFGNIGLGKDTLLCDADSLLLKPGLQNVYYLWQDSSTESSYLVKHPGDYSVKIFNQFGCSVSKDIHVTFQQCSVCQLYLPSAFTPNGDGLNDVFRVKTICAQVDDFDLQIYNRWGQLIFETDKLSEGWDGTFKKDPLAVGTYIYVMHYKRFGVRGIQIQKGTVTLIR